MKKIDFSVAILFGLGFLIGWFVVVPYLWFVVVPYLFGS